ncbi:NADH-quinone oxidoreductase subunit G [Nakamurella sp.]|uniref:NADH-quinone oxidoreductase subunit G n=1 Tax=Nakamurella sp. TaxID=1869182 RepID=UPI003B3BDD7A
MTQVAVPPAAAAGEPEPVPEGHVRLTIDGVSVIAPKGELVIRTAERIGTAIPRFCDHPLLDPVGACRQCLVEVEMGGRKMPKPQASCTQTVADGMVVNTQLTSPVAEKAQRSNLEFLLLNHPLDCPVCDKGGECPLQNQTMANGSNVSRLREPKRVFTKPVAISTEILLDRERCVLCQRCTRFSDQIAGDKFIDLLERGSAQQIGINSAEPFQSYFSGNTIQICPVGALTSAAYRFRARPFDLVSTSTVCEHCAGGCALRTDHRAGATLRRLARVDMDVNEEWNCDKGRFAFEYVRQPDRITRPLVRNAAGELEPTSWTEAMSVAAAGLLRARDNGGVGVLAGGRLTLTDAYAYAKFARVALRTNDIDFRARPHSAEEAQFLTERVAGTTPEHGGVTYASLESAPVVLLVALEPEEESAAVFLRLRKAARRRGVPVFSVAPFASRGLTKMFGTLIAAGPGDEVGIVRGLGSDEQASAGVADAAERNRLGALLRTTGAVVLVGERAAQTPGLLTAVAAMVDVTGAHLAWVPRRAGERGALDAGAIGTALPGGRPVTDPAARAAVEAAWGVPVPATPGRDTAGILAAVALPLPEDATGEAAGDAAGTDPDEPRGLAGLLVGGVEVSDLPDPEAALTAIAGAGFVVSLELRASAVTALADVVLPVAAAVEKSGAYVNWEGRVRPFDAALPDVGTLDEGRILDTLGVEMDVDLYTQTPSAAAGELARLGSWSAGAPLAAEAGELGLHVGGSPAASGGVAAGTGYRLASWRMNLDGGRAMDGEPHLAGTAKPTVVRIAPAAADALGVVDGDLLAVRGPAGSLALPVAVTPMVPDVVWLPAMVGGRPTGVRLGAAVGDRVHLDSVVATDDVIEGAVR